MLCSQAGVVDYFQEAFAEIVKRYAIRRPFVMRVRDQVRIDMKLDSPFAATVACHSVHHGRRNQEDRVKELQLAGVING